MPLPLPTQPDLEFTSYYAGIFSQVHSRVVHKKVAFVGWGLKEGYQGLQYGPYMFNGV